MATTVVENLTDTSTDVQLKKTNKESQPLSIDSNKHVLQRLNRKIPAFGFGLALVACFFCVTTTLMVKLTPSLNSVVMLTFRCFLQTILYVLPILYNGQSFLSDRDLNFMLIVRGCISYFCLVFRYASLRLIPFGDATSIMQSTPIYTSIIAYLWLGESFFTFLQVFCVLSSIAGVFLIAKPQLIWQIVSGSSEASSALHSQTLQGTFYALSASIVMSICLVIVRKLKKVPVMVLLFWFSLGSFLCGCIHLTYMRFYLEDLSVRWPSGAHEWMCTVTSSLSGVIGQLLMNSALKVEEAGPVSLARTGEILLSFVLQVLILRHEPLEWTSLLGAFIIFMAISLIALNRWAQDGSSPPTLLIWLFKPAREEKRIEPVLSIAVVQVVQSEQKSNPTSGCI